MKKYRVYFQLPADAYMIVKAANKKQARKIAVKKTERAAFFGDVLSGWNVDFSDDACVVSDDACVVAVSVEKRR